MSCPPDSEICAYLDGEATSASYERVEAHIDACGQCRRLVSELQKMQASATLGTAGDAHGILGPGDRVDRYEVRQRLGAGAMGVVFSAHDPKLQRDVALKLVFPEPQGSGNARQMWEAYAMAKLRHPNVVTVHDVVVHDGCLVLAMELVAGRTMRSWLESQPDLATILDVLRQAGQGLAAAHEAGLVHRDFKPDNVLVDDVGRAQVTDFGLARTLERDGIERGTLEREGAPDTSTFSTSTSAGAGAGAGAGVVVGTGAGVVVGTPAYLAPEQHRGEQASARSDQFAFCVSAYEAIYGRRPFTGRTLSALSVAVHRGLDGLPPGRTGVPRSVRRALARGLDVEPARRFPSMRALLEGLQPPSSSWRWGGAVVLAATVPLGIWWMMGAGPPMATPCASSTDPLEGAWDEQRRAQLDTAFAQTGHPYARESLHLVSDELDRYAGRWRAARLDSCEAHQRGEQSEALLDLRVACLDHRRTEVGALVERLMAGRDTRTVDQAVRHVHRLSPLAPCSHVASLRSPTPRPRDAAAQPLLAEADRSLAVAKADILAGDLEAAAQRVSEARRLAVEVGYRPLEAEASIVLAQLAHHWGQFDVAEDRFHDAISAGLASDHVRVVAEASMGLALVIGPSDGRVTEAQRWLEHSAGAIEQIGLDDLRARLLLARATVADRSGDLVAAQREHVAAVAAFEGLEPGAERERGLARALNDHAHTLLARGQYEAAISLLERALSLNERLLGPHHPDVAINVLQIGHARFKMRDPEGAQAMARRALAINEEVLGPNHPSVASSLVLLGLVAGVRDEVEESRRAFERAVSIGESALGPEHRVTLAAIGNLALLEENAGELESAFAQHDRLLAIQRRTLGDVHPNVAQTLYSMARLREKQGQPQTALELYTEAIELWEPQVDANHPGLCSATGHRGMLLLRRGDKAVARPLLERAADCLERAGHTDLVGPLRFALARAIVDRDPVQARALATWAHDQLEDQLEAQGDVEADRVEADRITAWLRRH